jgi:hypothetical protein
MNPLEKLKQKLMKKPTIQELQPVEVAINIENKENTNKDEKEEGEIVEEMKPTIEVIYENDKNYDRSDFLKRRAESKKSKVIMKPIMEAIEMKQTVEPISVVVEEPRVKKAKKVAKKPLVIEADDNENPEETVRIDVENLDVVPTEKKEPVIGVVEEPQQQQQQRKGRTTKKVEKGIAILGPENVVEIGDTPLSERLAKKQQPVLIKVSSYYMNNT